MGYRNCSCAWDWFPGLCAAIQARRRQRFQKYERELRAALAEHPPPTVAQVAQRLGISLNTLRKSCPALSAALSDRYPDRQRFQQAEIEKALTRFLEEDPPVPLVKLAMRLRKHPNVLRAASPDLCRRLRNRYVDHRRQEALQIKLVYEKEARQAVAKIAADGRYPSRVRVLSFIARRNPLLRSIYFTGQAVQRMREELRPSPD
jgi:transposase-like protein